MRTAGSIALAAVLVTLVGCNSVQSGHPALPKPRVVAENQLGQLGVRAKPDIQPQVSQRLLSDARAQVRRLASDGSSTLTGRQIAGLDVRLPLVPAGLRELPAVVDSRTPVFSQLASPAPDWADGFATVNAVDSSGLVVGEMGLRWAGGEWNASVWRDAPGKGEARERSKNLAAVLAALSSRLGGSLEETVTVYRGDLWLLGRRGSREGGAMLGLPALDNHTTGPRTIRRVYVGHDLAYWLNLP